MPTVTITDGYEIIVYWRDEHDPPHVHMFKADWEIRAYIGEAAEYWDTLGGRPKGKELRRAIELVALHLEACNENGGNTMGKAILPTDAQIEVGARHGALVAAHEPRGRTVEYDRTARKFVVELAAGATISFGPELLPELKAASEDALADVRLSPSGLGLRWRELDVDVNLTGLVMDIVAGQGWRSYFRALLAKELAGIRSEAKTKASRANGAKGGRPRKAAHGQEFEASAPPKEAKELAKKKNR